jgi:hypothetical protein
VPLGTPSALPTSASVLTKHSQVHSFCTWGKNAVITVVRFALCAQAGAFRGSTRSCFVRWRVPRARIHFGSFATFSFEPEAKCSKLLRKFLSQRCYLTLVYRLGIEPNLKLRLQGGWCTTEPPAHRGSGAQPVGPGTLTQGAPVFPGSSRVGIEPKTPGCEPPAHRGPGAHSGRGCCGRRQTEAQHASRTHYTHVT